MGHIRAQIQAIVCLLPAVRDAIDAFFDDEIDHAQFDSGLMQVRVHHDAIFLKYKIIECSDTFGSKRSPTYDSSSMIRPTLSVRRVTSGTSKFLVLKQCP